MNAVKQGIIACKQKIPEQILHDAFIAPWYQYNQKYNVNPISIDEHIMINVIRQRVLPDINMTHGIRTNIPMAGCRVEMIDSYSYVVFVPKEVPVEKPLTWWQKTLMNLGKLMLFQILVLHQ